MSDLVKWNLTVSSTTDADVRAFLAERGESDADLSRFVERAVSRQLLLELTREIHARNAHVDPEALMTLIDEELAEVRRAARAAA